MAPKAGQDSQVLPSKEAALFRTLLKQYETKQYKKGIKTADLILKKFPNNGETQAMKGLLYNCLEKKEEAYDLVKLGVKNNIRSHVCWHVYGLLYRSDREYDEAIKCYKNALRMEKDNLTVLRDLSQLQVQMRDLPGFLETRQILLETKSNNRQNWVAFALAYHLNGHYEVAAEVLDAYEHIVVDEDASSSDAYELNEILLYKVQILLEGGLFDQALATLQSAEERKVVKDRIGAMELRGRLYLGAGKFSEAEELYRKLVDLNPENYKYHDGLRAALQLIPTAETSAGVADEGQRAKLATEYAALRGKYPKSTAARRIPLDFLTGQEFVDAADAFVRPYLTKGIPSLFSALKPLYQSSEKAQQLGELMARLEASLASTGDFPPLPAGQTTASSNNSNNNNGNGDCDNGNTAVTGGGKFPEALVWARLYLVLHNDNLGNTETALRIIDQAISDTPSLTELHSARAVILKHAGDFPAALQSAEKARKQEHADRYLNCLAVKAAFQAGHMDLGETTAALFTRDGEQNNNLFDMQATWYEISSGRAYFAQGDLGRALKRFLKVDSHFSDFVEDQFDFHSYCVRKQTMRAYVDMLRMEDQLYSHKVYSKAMHGAVAAYLHLHAHPQGSKEKDEEDKRLAGMSAEEQKKYRAKKRKEEQKKVKEVEAAAAEAAKKEKGGADGKGASNAAAAAGKKIDPDPKGEQLAATPTPLEEASKLVKRLVQYAGHDVRNQILAAEVQCKRGRLVLALKAVLAGMKLVEKEHPGVHKELMRLAAATSKAAAAPQPAQGEPSAEATAADQINPVVLSVVQSQVSTLLGGKAADAYHAAWTAAHAGTSALHRAAVVEVAAHVYPDQTADALQKLIQGGAQGATHKQCVSIHHLLFTQLQDTSAAEDWKKACAQTFKWSRYFGGAALVQLEPEEKEEGKETAEKLAELKI